MANRTVLITGCTKGSIGYSLAKEFATLDWHVFATARRISSMEGLSSFPNVTLLPLDITSKESILSAQSHISSETGGKLDILYHNAGYRSLGLAIESSADEAFQMFNTNLFGILRMNQIFASMIVKTRGKIVFTGSVSAYTPHPTSSVYVATKAALAVYAETLRIEMKPFGVQVVHVATAAVTTGMSSARLEIAEGICYYFSSVKSICANAFSDSIYKPFETAINEGWAKLDGDAMDPDAYARTVVPKVVKQNPSNEIWCGTGALTVWAIEAFRLRWLYAPIFARMYGLNRMAPSLKKLA